MYSVLLASESETLDWSRKERARVGYRVPFSMWKRAVVLTGLSVSLVRVSGYTCVPLGVCVAIARAESCSFLCVRRFCLSRDQHGGSCVFSSSSRDFIRRVR